jgi:CxxC-x17-CxxC domain-containing protein
MDEQEYDERLLICQECGSDFLYGIEDQKRDDRDSRPIPRKCPRCRSGRKPQQAKSPPSRQASQQESGPRGGGRRRQQFQAEEYRSPSFQQDPQTEYRGPAFSDSDPSGHRRRSSSSGSSGSSGGRHQARPGGRQRFQIVCSNCGRQDTIPFRPSPNRPVYCHECYETHKYEEKKGRHGGKARSGKG